MSDLIEKHAPHPTGTVRLVNITGYLLAWNSEEDQSMMLEADGTDDVFIPVFSTEAKLQEFCKKHLQGVAYNIKVIDDSREMISSLPYWIMDGVRLRIMVDPWLTDSGAFRYSEIMREADPSTAVH